MTPESKIATMLLKRVTFSCQSEYQRGVSAWNFNVEDLKEQASLVSYVLIISSMTNGFHQLIMWLHSCFVCKQLDDDDSLAESREEDELCGEQLHNNNIKAKEKKLNPEVEEKTASSAEQTTPSPKCNVPQGKAEPVRRQTQSGPLSPGTLLTNSDSDKGHGYYLRFAIS